MDDGRVLVLGVGNTLMRDDGVGVHAVRALADAYEIPANVRVIDGGTAGFRLLGDIADVDHLLIVDALKRGGVPGSIYCLAAETLGPRRGPFVSAHEVGITELLAVAGFSGQLPKTKIIGVEPFETESVGLELTPPLLGALPRIVAAIVDELRAIGVDLSEKSERARPE